VAETKLAEALTQV